MNNGNTVLIRQLKLKAEGYTKAAELLEALSDSFDKPKRKRHLSAATRAKMAEAQKKRWADKKKKS